MKLFEKLDNHIKEINKTIFLEHADDMMDIMSISMISCWIKENMIDNKLKTDIKIFFKNKLDEISNKEVQ